ncbi:uncharacterized protein F5Z01DRAFT_477522 [Emericellopsis atlantica]|uniref:Uncharacterized protein n=1 Tax=Emericellopsis atlantica TaxID=2614577 RepID=A0A9P7ZQN7_9HYPO|nr:uncharacterized protein F5Z01DRAFT_477522 [Emericellopsis atlantica]KAG9256564.1 hypothetical protein F5Z01DRAFT_477522 [Emericellopsis atlantica]
MNMNRIEQEGFLDINTSACVDFSEPRSKLHPFLDSGSDTLQMLSLRTMAGTGKKRTASEASLSDYESDGSASGAVPPAKRIMRLLRPDLPDEPLHKIGTMPYLGKRKARTSSVTSDGDTDMEGGQGPTARRVVHFFRANNGDEDEVLFATGAPEIVGVAIRYPAPIVSQDPSTDDLSVEPEADEVDQTTNVDTNEPVADETDSNDSFSDQGEAEACTAGSVADSTFRTDGMKNALGDVAADSDATDFLGSFTQDVCASPESYHHLGQGTATGGEGEAGDNTGCLSPGQDMLVHEDAPQESSDRDGSPSSPDSQTALQRLTQKVEHLTKSLQIDVQNNGEQAQVPTLPPPDSAGLDCIPESHESAQKTSVDPSDDEDIASTPVGKTYCLVYDEESEEEAETPKATGPEIEPEALTGSDDSYTSSPAASELSIDSFALSEDVNGDRDELATALMMSYALDDDSKIGGTLLVDDESGDIGALGTDIMIGGAEDQRWDLYEFLPRSPPTPTAQSVVPMDYRTRRCSEGSSGQSTVVAYRGGSSCLSASGQSRSIVSIADVWMLDIDDPDIGLHGRENYLYGSWLLQDLSETMASLTIEQGDIPMPDAVVRRGRSFSGDGPALRYHTLPHVYGHMTTNYRALQDVYPQDRNISSEISPMSDSMELVSKCKGCMAHFQGVLAFCNVCMDITSD